MPTAARRSTRSTADASSSPCGALNSEGTAYDLLREKVLKHGFKASKDPDNVMATVWVREGVDKKDDGEGVDWVKEDGFTVAKYEAFWRTEMADYEEAIVDWRHKLPAEALKHIPKENIPDDDEDDDEEDLEVAKLTAKVSPEKRKKAAADGMKQSQAKKKRRKAKAEEEDLEDGLTPELLAMRAKWFGALDAGGEKVLGMEKAQKSDSATLKTMHARADDAISRFVMNLNDAPEVEAYKLATIDPMAQSAMDMIDAYVLDQARVLRGELVDSMRLANYRWGSKVEKHGGAASEKDDGAVEEEDAPEEEKVASNDTADDLLDDVEDQALTVGTPVEDV